MTNQEALSKLEQASTLMCEVLGVLKGHDFSTLDAAIKMCYNIEDCLEQRILKESKVLKYKNNWESDEYYLNGQRVDNIEFVEIDGKRYDVVNRMVSITYSDHGHSYQARSRHYYIKEKVFGTVMEIDLNTIVNKTEVKVVD